MSVDKSVSKWAGKLKEVESIETPQLSRFTKKKKHYFLHFDQAFTQLVRIYANAFKRLQLISFEEIHSFACIKIQKKKILRNILNYYKFFRILILLKFFGRWGRNSLFKNNTKKKISLRQFVSIIFGKIINDKFHSFMKIKHIMNKKIKVKIFYNK